MKKSYECEVCHKIYDCEDECLACEAKHAEEDKAEEDKVKYYENALTEIFNKIELYEDDLKEEYKNLREILADMKEALPNYIYTYKRKDNEKPEIILQKNNHNAIESVFGMGVNDWINLTNEVKSTLTSAFKNFFDYD